MKLTQIAVLVAGFSGTVLGATVQETNVTVPAITNAPSSPATTEVWEAKSRSANQTAWIVTRYHTNAAAQVTVSTNAFVELASGLNVTNALGAWRPADPSLSVAPSGAAEATNTLTHIRILPDITQPDAVQMSLGSTTIKIHPLCLSFYDPLDGRSELLASITNAAGGVWLTASNELTFSNCFDTVRASVVFRNSKSGLEQFVLIQERLPDPALFQFSEHCRLELFSVMTDDTPTLQISNRILSQVTDQAQAQAMVESTFTDSTLNFGGFGGLTMIPGHTFLTSASGRLRSHAPGGVPVTKRFEVINGARILIEACEFAKIRPLIQSLPAHTDGAALKFGVPASAGHANDQPKPANSSPYPSPFLAAQVSSAVSSSGAPAAAPTLNASRGRTANPQARTPALQAALNKHLVRGGEEESSSLLREPAEAGTPNVAASSRATMLTRVPRSVSSTSRTIAKIQIAQTSAPHQSSTAQPSTVAALALDWETVPTGAVYEPLVCRGDTTYLVSDLCIYLAKVTFYGGTCVKYVPDDEGDASLQLWDEVSWLTDARRPAIFTSKYDPIGTIISSARPPLRYDQPVGISQDTNLIHHIRVSYADYGLHLGSGLPMGNVRHAQFTHCGAVIASDWGTVNLENALLSEVSSAFMGVAYHGNGVNLTVAYCTNLVTAYPGYDPDGCSADMTNCLFYAVTGSDVEWTDPWNQFYTTNDIAFTNLFQPAGSGQFYLHTDLCRTNGTTDINPYLLADIFHRTTRAPTMLTNVTIPTNFTMSPQFPHTISDVPFGYSYEILDYIVSKVNVVSNATVTASGGVAIGVDYSCLDEWGSAWGFILDSARFFSQGNPGPGLNHLTRAHTVQEESSGNPDTRAFFADNWWNYPAQPSEARFRFTDISQLSEDGKFIYAGLTFSALEWTHSRFYNPYLVVDTSGAATLICGLTNSFWESGTVEFGLGFSSSAVAVHLRNNLIRNGFWHFVDGTTNWSFRDNLFETLGDLNDHGASVQNSFNAYYAMNLDNFDLEGPGNVYLDSLSYEAGPFSAWYQPDGSPLRAAGSRPANEAGLYWFTPTCNPQEMEGNSDPVSIGLHQVAVDDSGHQPIDTDLDGVPNVIADVNGNGISDENEHSFINPVIQPSSTNICSPLNSPTNSSTPPRPSAMPTRPT